jgi:hypothetical protein
MLFPSPLSENMKSFMDDLKIDKDQFEPNVTCDVFVWRNNIMNGRQSSPGGQRMMSMAHSAAAKQRPDLVSTFNIALRAAFACTNPESVKKTNY